MGKSCVLIPNAKGSDLPSKLYQDLLKITNNNRTLTNMLWALSLDSATLQSLGINLYSEPSAVLLLDSLGNVDKLLGETSYIRYVNEKEGTADLLFETYSEASNFLVDMDIKYPNVATIVEETLEGFKVQIKEATRENRNILFRLQALKNLNDRLLGYVNDLGFDIDVVDDLETPALFSPLHAETNAKGLKTAIKISKNQLGYEALPEEVSHLLLSGLKRHPVVQRLLQALQDRSLLLEILGETYDLYVEKYDNDINRLAEEAAGRLLALHFADIAGLNDLLLFISLKVINRVRDILLNGSTSYIDNLLKLVDDDIKELTEDTFGSDLLIDLFDFESTLSSNALYHISNNVSAIAKINQKAYEKLAKRIKINSLSKKDQNLTKEDKIYQAYIKKKLEAAEYAASCSKFVDYVVKDVATLKKQLEDLKVQLLGSNQTSWPVLKRTFRLLRNLQSANEAYKDVIEALSTVKTSGIATAELSDLQAEDLENLAKDALTALNSLADDYENLRINSLVKFYLRYWGNDKTIKAADGKETVLTLRGVLESTVGDISGFDRMINCVANSKDLLLLLVDTAYKDATNTRDMQIQKLQQRLGALQQRYREAAGTDDVSNIYVRDDNGKPTGMLKSDRDYKRFFKELSEETKKWKDLGKTNDEIDKLRSQWQYKHTKLVDVTPNIADKNYKRYERMPIYKSNDLSTLSEAERAYYNEFIEIKKELDMLLPHKNTHLYRAPLIEKSAISSIAGGTSVKKVIKDFKSKYITDAGSNKRYIIADFGGKEVQKVPVYYTTMLDDMSRLSLDATDALLKYGAMANNYTAMNDIANVLEVTYSLILDRDVTMTRGNKILYERFKIGNEAFLQDYVIKGSDTQAAKRLRTYIDSGVYDRQKGIEAITIGNKEINVAKTGDSVKTFTTHRGLGFNPFSGITNLTMGMAQTAIQMIGGKYFNAKNVMKANAFYFANVGKSCLELYNKVRKNKLSLILDKFDSLEEFFKGINDSDLNKKLFNKLLNKVNPLFLNTMGEHYLHAIGTCAVLDSVKVTIDDKPISLLKALEVKEKKITGVDGFEYTTYDLVLPENATFEDGSTGKNFNEGDKIFLTTKLKSLEVNHKMHGAFSDIDKGEIHRSVWGRLVAQFRQWMPAFYDNRFGGQRQSLLFDKEEDRGVYRTMLNFMRGSIIDLAHGRFNILTNFRSLSKFELANVRLALTELAMLGLVIFSLGGKVLGKPDKDDPWEKNMLRYTLYRLKTELGAGAPTPEFFKSIITLVQSPLPAMGGFDSVLKLLNFGDLNETVQTGKYAGWNKYLKNAYYAVPYVRNVGRVKELIEGDISMFNPYTKVTVR